MIQSSVYFYFNIARIRNNLTPAAVHSFRDIYIARIGLYNKHLIGKQTACNIPRIGFNKNLSGI